jgi:hypothetical protein
MTQTSDMNLHGALRRTTLVGGSWLNDFEVATS